MVIALLLTLATAGGTAALGQAGVELGRQDQVVDVAQAVCDQDLGLPMSYAGGIVLLAQNDNKFKCVETCAHTRESCEQEINAMDKPGTQKNWEASTKCHQQYLQCLDKCN
jgi:hypothetical protein